MIWFYALLAAGVLVAILLNLANRLDKFHHRIDVARERLYTTLTQRSFWVQQVAQTGVLDAAESMLLVTAADTAVLAGKDQKFIAESELSQLLRVLMDQGSGTELLEHSAPARDSYLQLVAACDRVRHARQVLNAQVIGAQVLHNRKVSQVFRLAGSAPDPVIIEFDDRLPNSFSPGEIQSSLDGLD